MVITASEALPSPKPEKSRKKSSHKGNLFLGSLLGGLGDLASTLVSLDDGLDDTDGDGLTHITDGETTEGRILSEGLNAHRLGGNHLDDSGITRLDELGPALNRLTRTAINLLEELGELAGDVGSVAIQDRSVTSTDLAGVIKDDDLGVEGLGTLGGVVLGVTGNVTTADFLDGNVLDVEANVVAGHTLNELLVVHLNGLDFGGHTSGGEGDDHTGFDDTSLDTTDGDRANTANLVHILEGKTEGLVGGTARRVDGINSLEEGLTRGLGLGLLLPALVPWAVAGGLNHVVAVEAGDGDERNGLGVVADLLDEVGSLLNDFLETGLGPLSGVHLVDSNDELLDTEGIGEQGVLTSLAILGDTSLELTSTGSDDEDSAIGLGGTSDHVLDEITMTGSVNDGDIVLRGFELPESDINGDTTLTLSLELVEHPSVLKGTLAEFGSFLLELLDGTLVDTTALVDQVAGGGGLSGVDVADDDHVDVDLFFGDDGGLTAVPDFLAGS